MRHAVSVEVVLSDLFATLRKEHRSAPLVAGILGVDRDATGGVYRVWLDRLVHAPDEEWNGEWSVSGAISSILTKR